MDEIEKHHKWREKTFGSVLKPKRTSFDALDKYGILTLTSNINDKDFLICYNFVLKYLKKLTKLDLDFLESGYLLDEKEREKTEQIIKINFFREMFKPYSKIIEEVNKFEVNCIIFYEDENGNIVHTGIGIFLFGKLWILSKFGSGPIYLHLPTRVPEHYGLPKYFFKVNNSDYKNYLKRVEIALEKQINSMEKLKTKGFFEKLLSKLGL